MKWEEKLHIMQTLEPNLLKMRSPGNWYCSVPGEIGGNGILQSDFFNAKTPTLAVLGAWIIVESLPENRHLRISGMDGKSFRWDKISKKFITVNPNTSQPY